MGCDIHLHVEIKIAGKWEHYNHPDVNRCYALFGKMAGVRDDRIKPISLPKGLPNDASITTKFDSEYVQGHSHSYLTSKEVVKLILWGTNYFDRDDWWDSDFFGYLFDSGFDNFIKYPEEYPEGLEDFRFVFWFDN